MIKKKTGYRRFKGVKYRCVLCKSRRMGGYELVRGQRKWVCNICLVESYFRLKGNYYDSNMVKVEGRDPRITYTHGEV